MRLVTRGEGPGGEPDDAAIGVALTGLLSRLGDSLQREHVAFGIGDGALMVLRDGVWTGVFTPGETAAERGLRLPAAAQQVRCARLTTRPGDPPRCAVRPWRTCSCAPRWGTGSRPLGGAPASSHLVPLRGERAGAVSRG
ncbi:hypothetical protein ACFQ51_37600 [Streptomyces kaempferi]